MPDPNGFDAKAFYRFNNSAFPGNTLSAGLQKDSDGAISMTAAGSLSSENWQLYYQQGRYFIRNYDFKADYQLGLDARSGSVPIMMRTSGDLGQQWTISKVDTTKFTLTNGLYGNGTMLALVGGNSIPGMQPSSTGAQWEVTINTSAGPPKNQDPDMMVDVANFEVASSSTSALPSATSSSISRSSATPVLTTPSRAPINASPSPPSSTTSTISESSLSAGAIGGIVVGGVVFLIAIIVLAYLLLRRRKAKKTRSNSLPPELLPSREIPAEMASSEAPPYSPPHEKEVYRYELSTPESPMATPTKEGYRYELGS